MIVFMLNLNKLDAFVLCEHEKIFIRNLCFFFLYGYSWPRGQSIHTYKHLNDTKLITIIYGYMWIVLFASNQNNLRENIGLASFAQKICKGGGWWGTS